MFHTFALDPRLAEGSGNDGDGDKLMAVIWHTGGDGDATQAIG